MKILKTPSFLACCLLILLAPSAYSSPETPSSVVSGDSESKSAPMAAGVVKITGSTYSIEVKKPLRVRRIDVMGNKGSHEAIIRRQLSLEKGSLITAADLRDSKRRVEALDCFENGSVFWQVHQVSEGLADLELVVKERNKPGSFSLFATLFRERNETDICPGVHIRKVDIFGRACMADIIIADPRTDHGACRFKFVAPSLFESNLSSRFDVYYKAKEYSPWTWSREYPQERVAGGSVNVGVRLPEFDRDVKLGCEVGFERGGLINNDEFNRGKRRLTDFGHYCDFLFDRIQRGGAFAWIEACVEKDTRNHPVAPTEGGQVAVSGMLGLPSANIDSSFLKLETFGSLYISLIGEDTLLFILRAKAGTIYDISGASCIPYRELFHVGGQDSLRGFWMGSAGPVLARADAKNEWNSTSLGAQRQVVCSAELQVPIPIFESYKIVGRVFYDAGCGWNADLKDIPANALTFVVHDDFKIRHVAGFGFTFQDSFSLDFGYKLDRDDAFPERSLFIQGGLNFAW